MTRNTQIDHNSKIKKSARYNGGCMMTCRMMGGEAMLWVGGGQVQGASGEYLVPGWWECRHDCGTFVQQVAGRSGSKGSARLEGCRGKVAGGYGCKRDNSVNDWPWQLELLLISAIAPGWMRSKKKYLNLFGPGILLVTGPVVFYFAPVAAPHPLIALQSRTDYHDHTKLLANSGAGTGMTTIAFGRYTRASVGDAYRGTRVKDEHFSGTLQERYDVEWSQSY
ncbi:hypothetical protein EDB19DRAFT_2027514 [Suillus lakei]|nr:hypothetical protein EDB19DRAFT_2027514 [Suillus lakei]